jgi:hypothetical protein
MYHGAKIGIFVLITFFMFGIVYAPASPEPTTIIKNVDFTGTLGMVSYEHTFFGIGGVSATTLSFQNGSDVATFKFNKDLSVIVGNNYTVAYEQKEEYYYNFSLPIYPGLQWNWIAILRNMGMGQFYNSTTITPQNVILATNENHKMQTENQK